MLQSGDYAREICYFVVVHASPFPLKPVCIIYFSLLGQYPFCFCFVFCFFFGVAQAFKRRFCSGIRYFLGVSASNYVQICFKEAIMLVKYATLWLFTLPLSPCNLFVIFTLALAGDIAFFFYRVHNVVFNACMYACM